MSDLCKKAPASDGNVTGKDVSDVANAPWDTRPIRKAEPVLFIRKTGDAAQAARLLFPVRRILGIRRANGSELYPVDSVEVSGSELIARNIHLPGLSAEELYPRKKSDHAIERHRTEDRMMLYREGHYFHDLQVLVDYETDAVWHGPTPPRQQDRLPRLRSLASNSEPFSVSLLGDSISDGSNASGFTGASPRQPAYGALFCHWLERLTGSRVQFQNFSKGGMKSDWGVNQAPRIAGHQPDLLILAFGMNDASDKMPVDQFRKNISRIISITEENSPHTEIILIAGMSPNPDWHLATPAHRHALWLALQSLTSQKVALCDITPTWDHLVARKGFMSLTGNGINHPNDFGHALYAAALSKSIGLARPDSL